MPSRFQVSSVEPLREGDVIAAAQCITLDAEAFPYASAPFTLHSESSYVWVARDAGDARVIGFIATRARLVALHIDGLTVDSAYRRRGVGRALLREVIETSRARDIRMIALHVSVANRAAIALYNAEGFVVKGRLHG